MPRIDVNGAKLWYTESGAGRPVVLLHSSASSSAKWCILRAQLEAHYRVLALDLYGYGASDPWPGHRALTLADEAALVEAVMARCEGPVHLVGHSYGGAVALRVGLHRPQGLRSLTLIEPVAFNLLRGGDAADQSLLGEVAEIGSAVSEGVMSGDTWGAMARFVDYWNGEGAWSRTRLETRAALSHLTGKVAQDFHAVFSDPTPLEACRWLRVSTLVLSGEASPAPVRRIAEMLGAALPDARHVALREAGHMLPLSHGDTVAGLIRGHFAETEAGRKQAA